MPPCWEMGSPPTSCSQPSSIPSGPNHGTFPLPPLLTVTLAQQLRWVFASTLMSLRVFLAKSCTREARRLVCAQRGLPKMSVWGLQMPKVCFFPMSLQPCSAGAVIHQHRIIILPLETCLDNSGKQEPYKHPPSSLAVARPGDFSFLG